MKKLVLPIFVIIAGLALSCQSDKKDDTSGVSPEKGRPVTDRHDITLKMADSLVKEYMRNSKDTSTKSLWFSYKEIHKIDSLLTISMRKISKENEKNKVSHKLTIDGVRIYFGRYAPDADSGHRNKNTLVIVPTVLKISTDNPHQEIHADFFAKSIQYLSPQNNGELCPSHCDGTELPLKPKMIQH